MRSDPTLFEEYAHQCKQRSQSAHDPHVRTSLQISRTNGAIWLIWHARWRRRSATEWVSMRRVHYPDSASPILKIDCLPRG
jgi:hypothetical protein